MTTAIVHTAFALGLEAIKVQVACTLTGRHSVQGMRAPPGGFTEYFKRLRHGMRAQGFSPVMGDLTVITETDVPPPHDAVLDLAIVQALLQASGQVPELVECPMLGGVTREGAVQPVRGASILASREVGRRVFCHPDNAVMAHVAGAVPFVVRSLNDLPGHHPRSDTGAFWEMDAIEEPVQNTAGLTFDEDVLGRVVAAARTRRPLVLRGKGMEPLRLAARLPGILPRMSTVTRRTVTQIHDAAGLPATEAVRQRPFRAPHMSVSMAGLLGARVTCPGELALAHEGVLFLDEASGWAPRHLDALHRIEMEGKVISVVTHGRRVAFPADAWLVAGDDRSRGEEWLQHPLWRRAEVIDLVAPGQGAPWPASVVLRQRVSG